MTLAERALAAANLGEARAILAAEFDQDQDIKDRYDWAHAAIYETTNGYVEDRLGNLSPPFRYPFNRIDEHLKVAGAHLEQCLNRQEALFDLESACIGAVIDALNSDRIFELDRQIERNRVLAEAMAANAPDPAALARAVDDKYAIRRKVFDFQLGQFRTPGGSRNFNGRIGFLRELQFYSVRIIYERLAAARSGLSAAGFGMMVPLPKWEAHNADILGNLVAWVRTATMFIDERAVVETPVTISINSLEDAKYFRRKDGTAVTAQDIQSALQVGGFDEFQLVVDATLFKDRINWPDGPRARLGRLSIGIILEDSFDSDLSQAENKEEREKRASLAAQFRSWRSRLRFGARIRPSFQTARFADGSTDTWHPPRILLDGQVPVAEMLDNDSLVSLPVDRTLNLDARGTWEITILGQWSLPEGRQNIAGGFYPWYRWTSPRGIAIVMTVYLAS